MDKEILRLENLTIGYEAKKPILTDITFCLVEGEAVGVAGPNGIGKTTLFKTILGVTSPLQGEIIFKERKIKTKTDTSWARSQIGYVSQGRGRGKLPLIVEEMVLLGRWGTYFSGFQRPQKSDRRAAKEAMEIMGITKLRKRDCRELSGGEYQRAVIAQALARDASLLLLDEPGTFLDFESRQEFTAQLKELRKSLPISILIVSHHREELDNLVDRVLILGD
jgi:ABC-type Mn2+/Zn2+ transport system ATPase subunit